jgi:hypothetical protein
MVAGAIDTTKDCRPHVDWRETNDFYTVKTIIFIQYCADVNSKGGTFKGFLSRQFFHVGKKAFVYFLLVYGRAYGFASIECGVLIVFLPRELSTRGMDKGAACTPLMKFMRDRQQATQAALSNVLWSLERIYARHCGRRVPCW